MKFRDKLAHWCWGWTEALPDALLISEPSSHLGGYAKALKMQGETGTSHPDVPVDHSKVYVLRDEDLDRYLKQLAELDLSLRMAIASVWAAASLRFGQPWLASQRAIKKLKQLSNRRVRQIRAAQSKAVLCQDRLGIGITPRSFQATTSAAGN